MKPAATSRPFKNCPPECLAALRPAGCGWIGTCGHSQYKALVNRKEVYAAKCQGCPFWLLSHRGGMVCANPENCNKPEVVTNDATGRDVAQLQQIGFESKI